MNHTGYDDQPDSIDNYKHELSVMNEMITYIPDNLREQAIKKGVLLISAVLFPSLSS